MKKTVFYVIFAISASVFVLQSCTKFGNEPYREIAPTLPSEIYDYNSMDNLSAQYKSTIPAETLNGITDAGATLGRVLFYDKKMSLNNSTACATCHLQDKAFADGKKLSEGFFNEMTTRNSPAIINLVRGEKFFWDARSEQLSDMVLNPVQDHIEMGLENLDNLVEKLAATSYYPELFNDAFGSSDVTKERVSGALTQFLRSMSSTQSKFDAGNETNFANFTASELRGKALFEDVGCVNCHGGLDFKGEDDQLFDEANIGLDMVYEDKGIRNGIFKIPSLRNVELTGPYMHDGRFETLRQVVDHYSDKSVNHPHLDDRLKSNSLVPGLPGLWGGDPTLGPLTLTHLNWTNAEKEDVIAFLKTLTDNELITDERFSDPFQE